MKTRKEIIGKVFKPKKIMNSHELFDPDVDYVAEYDPSLDHKSIIFNHDFDGEFIISKEDVIALAKEFDLLVFEKSSEL